MLRTAIKRLSGAIGLRKYKNGYTHLVKLNLKTYSTYTLVITYDKEISDMATTLNSNIREVLNEKFMPSLQLERLEYMGYEVILSKEEITLTDIEQMFPELLL